MSTGGCNQRNQSLLSHSPSDSSPNQHGWRLCCGSKERVWRGVAWRGILWSPTWVLYTVRCLPLPCRPAASLNDYFYTSCCHPLAMVPLCCLFRPRGWEKAISCHRSMQWLTWRSLDLSMAVTYSHSIPGGCASELKIPQHNIEDNAAERG